ncbi:MAG: hypothetical protein H0X34_11755 [Chthoniobacterales bacterium]|nr:hypothetical protein [Chthoniobacterales bacterium]
MMGSCGEGAGVFCGRRVLRGAAKKLAEQEVRGQGLTAAGIELFPPHPVADSRPQFVSRCILTPDYSYNSPPGAS